MLSILKQFLANRSQHVRVTVAESLSRDLVKVSEWCDVWGMKLNANKTKTMIASRSRTMHPHSPPLTIGLTVLKESDDLVILGVTFAFKTTFDKHLRSVSRAASEWHGILRKSRHVFYDRLGDAFTVLFCPFLVMFCSALLGCRYTPLGNPGACLNSFLGDFKIFF